MTPHKLTRSFISAGRENRFIKPEQEWMKAVFGCILKVARRERQFTVDAIWQEIDNLTAKGKMPRANIDHRVLGPMIRHMVSEGILGSTQYYTKSMRPGGGSRPVTIWESYIYNKTTKAAA